ncbi:MAG: hypothetical protein RLZZ203_713 [Cyanobacteriota bacterium]
MVSNTYLGILFIQNCLQNFWCQDLLIVFILLNRLRIIAAIALGILLIAKHRGLIHAVKPVMNDLISQTSFRVSNQLYQEVLCAANELNE